MICGSMFSGKTEELIRRLRRAVIANQKVAIFKPALDERYSKDEVVSHDMRSVSSILVHHPDEIPAKAEDADVIAIDEAQFFSNALVRVVQDLALNGRRVIIAGLDMDFNANAFGPVPELLAIAEYVTKLHAICAECGSLAHHSFRMDSNMEQILIGEKDKYKPLCRSCYHRLKTS